LSAAGQIRRREHDAILAVAREDAADEQRLEPDHRHLVSGGVLEAHDRARAGVDGEQLRIARLVGEARRAQRHIDAHAVQAVGSRALQLQHAAVVQPLELAHQIGGGEREPRIQLERRGVDLRGQRPAASLEGAGHGHAEIEHVDRDGECGDAQHAEDEAFQRMSSSAGARRL
jgi:hypothetical protein